MGKMVIVDVVMAMTWVAIVIVNVMSVVAVVVIAMMAVIVVVDRTRRVVIVVACGGVSASRVLSFRSAMRCQRHVQEHPGDECLQSHGAHLRQRRDQRWSRDEPTDIRQDHAERDPPHRPHRAA